MSIQVVSDTKCMNTKYFQTLAVISLSILPLAMNVSVVSAAGTPDIQAMCAQLDDAWNHIDATAAARFYAPSMVLLNQKGKPTNAKLINQTMDTYFKRAQSVVSRRIVKSSQTDGTGVAATVKWTMDITAINPKSGDLDTVQTSVTERQHWTQIGGEWKIDRVRLLDTYMQVDGKPVKPI